MADWLPILEQFRAFLAGQGIARDGVCRIKGQITLTGGEPFAHPHLFEICEAFVERGMSVGICTNATLADDALQ